MDKKQCILNYIQKQTPIDLSTLGFTIIKTDEQFKNAYNMHDLAVSYAGTQYLQHEFTLLPIGVDLRQQKVIIREELPDYLAEKGDRLFCFDAKAKKSVSSFGWVNERAAVSYRKLADACHVKVYATFVRVVGGKVMGDTGHCDVEQEPIRRERAWDGNRVWVYEWQKGLAAI